MLRANSAIAFLNSLFIGVVPADLVGVSITLTATNDLDIRLSDYSGSEKVIFLKDTLVSLL
jgi:hypothetical protein